MDKNKLRGVNLMSRQLMSVKLRKVGDPESRDTLNNSRDKSYKYREVNRKKSIRTVKEQSNDVRLSIPVLNIDKRVLLRVSRVLM